MARYSVLSLASEADRVNRTIAEDMLRHPQRCERCQLDWARACLARLDAEAVERIEHDAHGQGLLFPTSTTAELLD